jgi:hypothetical protein
MQPVEMSTAQVPVQSSGVEPAGLNQTNMATSSPLLNPISGNAVDNGVQPDRPQLLNSTDFGLSYHVDEATRNKIVIMIVLLTSLLS